MLHLPRAARELSIEVDLIVDLSVINPFDFFVEPGAASYPFDYETSLAKELAPYLETEPAGPRLKALVESLRGSDVNTIDYVVALNQRLNKEIRYVIRLEPGIQTCEETLTLASGSCRDSGWVLVQLFRQLGLAARFVSGYLIQLKPDVEALDGPSGSPIDVPDLHAWAEVYLPGAGWVGLDPTSGLLAAEGHIPLACAAHPLSASPISGSFGYAKDSKCGPKDTCEPVFSFEMSVARVHEDPRVTKPYNDQQWAAIEALGHQVDARLKESDVRLTMGGEPTFVSIDDMEGIEWNTAALGKEKRRLANQLLLRLRDKFAPGALLHHGQGKWYPGETLPRWAFGCFWRHDGVPLWKNPKLYAVDEDRDYKHGPDQALQFAQDLAQRLGVSQAFCRPAYEDVYYYLWSERRLPANIDPSKSRLKDPEERARLATLLERGLGQVVGIALPLRRDERGSSARWESAAMILRQDQLYLVPGDSPMGFRLPLDSLPWEPPDEIEPLGEVDPFTDLGPLPARADLERQRRLPGTLDQGVGHGHAAPAGSEHEGDSEPVTGRVPVIRTTLCVEPREGRLHVFMPPLKHVEDYFELVTAVENVAQSLGMPILIEGYPPPHDHRVNQLSVTPDPGVIEVNLHPARDWAEMVAQTTTLYEEARQTRLGTEKFMLDGRHTGTGGGNHIVLGGPTAADSPILRRPDVLRSLVSYWHNHPSLSYLFSGQFVGPTSQAPRLDEARNDSLYEMEIAFTQIPDRGGCPPWLVDRVFRNLLVDVTGNTHRAEFCIDKLYSPDSASGRRGLVEMRAFEMPPHARMSLVQQLLIRALVSRFWDRPYHGKLARWGTELHDKYLLPHFLDEDFRDVVDELKAAGLPMESEWFAPHFEFKFPRFGTVAHRGVVAELRQAIEPWHVLGEESGGGGTARYVDSSLERLEVKVTGMTQGRHFVACNGRRVPLQPTGTNGEFVAGVRFRAWQPPSCLHPTIGVHAPLVFDLVDRWSGRSLGGFTYHVSHPGGRSYDRFPVNAYEADARRTTRFVPFGHGPGASSAIAEEPNPEAPATLDLRRPPRPAGPAGG